MLGVDRPEPGHRRSQSAIATASNTRSGSPIPTARPAPDSSTSTGATPSSWRRSRAPTSSSKSSWRSSAASTSRRRKGTAVRGTRNWTAAMQRARGQAERYAKALPVDHGWPPFLIIVDVGHCFELYADFSRTGKSYSQFPDAQGFRIPLDGLRDPKIRERLRRSGPTRSRSTPRGGRPRSPARSLIASPSSPAPWRSDGTIREAGRGLPHALPVLHVRRGRGPAARKTASPSS